MLALDMDISYAFQLSVTSNTTNNLQHEDLYPYCFFVICMCDFRQILYIACYKIIMAILSPIPSKLLFIRTNTLNYCSSRCEENGGLTPVPAVMERSASVLCEPCKHLNSRMHIFR
jgi:hypothetical protein